MTDLAICQTVTVDTGDVDVVITDTPSVFLFADVDVHSAEDDVLIVVTIWSKEDTP